MDGYLQNIINIPPNLKPEDYASIYGGGAAPGMPLPMNYNMGQAQNVPMAPVDQNFSIPGMGMPQQQMPQQPPPELQHVTDVLQQYIKSKQDSQGNNGLTGDILAQRFQPQMQDISKSIVSTNAAYGAPNIVKPLSVYEAASQRANSELSPYTTALDIQGKQLGNQNAQITNQYLPQEKQADIAMKNAQAQTASGFGLFGGGSGAGANGTGQPLSGDAFLKNLNPAMANMVQGIVQGRIPYPAGMALRTPMGQQLAAAVNAYDPTFDSINAGNRAKVLQGFSVGGKEATALNALNTVAGHLKILADSGNALNNFSGFPGATYANQAVNAVESASGDPRLKTFMAARDAVSNELAKAYRGGVVSDSERKSWDDALSSASSPEQFKAVFGTLSDLLQSKIGALQQQYTQGMGPYARPIQFITPGAQATFDQLGAGSPQAGNAQSAQAGGISEGATATNQQTGQKITYRNGQWQ